MANNGKNRAERLQRGADLFARAGMLAQDEVFLRSKRARLEENVVRDGHFADVVEEAGAPEGGDFFLGQPLVLAQEHGILRQPLAVTARVRVFGFDAERQGKKDCLGAFQFIGVGFQAQKRRNAGHQFGAVNRLGEEIVGACLNSLDAILGGGKSCYQDDGSKPGLRVPLDAAADLEPGEVRQHHVEKEKVGTEAGNLLKRVLSIAGAGNLQALRTQQSFQTSAARRVVFNDENLACEDLERALPEANLAKEGAGSL